MFTLWERLKRKEARISCGTRVLMPPQGRIRPGMIEREVKLIDRLGY